MASTTKAIVYVSKGKAEVKDVAKPKLRDGYILVKVKAVAVNPTDWKHIDLGFPAPGSRMGCDYAGVVEEVGPNVTKPFKKGDRIAGAAHGGDRLQLENGAFGNYIAVKGDVQIKVPDNVSDEDAATLGISFGTVGQGLYKTLGLALPTTPVKTPEYVLIHGGSTATGIYGIQYAKASGYKVITTASPHNFDYLKSLGAEKVFDYKSPTVGQDIRKYTNNSLKYGWDCTGTGEKVIAGGLSSEGGKYAAIMPPNKDEILKINPKVDGPHVTLMYFIFGEPVAKVYMMTEDAPPMPDEFEFAKKFSDITRELLAQGKLKAPRVILNKDGSGLQGVLKGLDELRHDKVSGGKLVYTL